MKKELLFEVIDLQMSDCVLNAQGCDSSNGNDDGDDWWRDCQDCNATRV